jgi:hypothetical protein
MCVFILPFVYCKEVTTIDGMASVICAVVRAVVDPILVPGSAKTKIVIRDLQRILCNPAQTQTMHPNQKSTYLSHRYNAHVQQLHSNDQLYLACTRAPLKTQFGC